MFHQPLARSLHKVVRAERPAQLRRAEGAGTPLGELMARLRLGQEERELPQEGRVEAVVPVPELRARLHPVTWVARAAMATSRAKGSSPIPTTLLSRTLPAAEEAAGRETEHRVVPSEVWAEATAVQAERARVVVREVRTLPGTTFRTSVVGEAEPGPARTSLTLSCKAI